MKPANDAGTIRTKTYFADTVIAAMAEARKDLGEDALLLQSSQTSEAERTEGSYKVTFVLPGANGSEEREIAPNSTDLGYAERSLVDQLKTEFRQLRNELDNVRNNVMRLQMSGESEAAALIGKLTEAGVEPLLAEEIYRSAGRHPGPISINAASRDAHTVVNAISSEMERRLIANVNTWSDRTIIALAGPSGCGKTSTLVKLAAVEGLAKKRTVRLLSTDTVRVGAAQQLRSYAAILGVPVTFVEDPGTLSGLLSVLREEVVLIDTPGYSAASIHSGLSLAGALSDNEAIETHLVLPASLPYGVLKTIGERFEPFNARKLIFTRLDEAEGAGALFSLAARRALAVAYLCNGDVIPNDIERATGGAIVSRIAGNLKETVRSAA